MEKAHYRTAQSVFQYSLWESGHGAIVPVAQVAAGIPAAGGLAG